MYQKDNQVKFDEEYNLLPVTNDAVTQVSADKPELKPFLDALPNALFVPVSIPAWDKVNTEVKNQIGDALKDPQKGLDNLQQVAQTAGQ
ncbi:hypothetical protein ACFQZC_16950 [Streptacidiphilus monticola]